MSVNELARAAGVSVSYVYAIESGVRGSRVEELYRVARALGVGIEELVGSVSDGCGGDRQRVCRGGPAAGLNRREDTRC
ncbi:helix-turn-helix transcriptional regulator [Kyrpidia sp.]|uniref:helix-turn-helix domain-containing protein n=1 Tax=Kyrpidia sp. TaxID=2073077 RepID=UPI0025845C51|nr:helix-turn-helix transcriptional regulator [Kyrpidia sp.]